MTLKEIEDEVTPLLRLAEWCAEFAMQSQDFLESPLDEISAKAVAALERYHSGPPVPVDLEREARDREAYRSNLAMIPELGIKNLRGLYKDVSDCGTVKQFEAFNALLDMVRAYRENER